MSGSQKEEVLRGNAEKRRVTVKRLIVDALILGAAGLLWLFAHGKWIFPLAAWLAPMLMLHFMRRSQGATAPMAAAAVVAAATYASFRGVIPLDGIGFTAFCIGFGAFFLMPMLLDRWAVRRLPGFMATLAFPTAYVALEYAAASLSPFGSWGSWAYTQYGNLPFMQLARFTGLWGMTFMIMWGASAGSWCWARRRRWVAIRTGATLYAAVLAAILLAGSAQLLALRPSAPAVRVAALTLQAEDGFKRQASEAVRGRLSAEELAQFRERTIANQDELLDRTRLEARAGARFVVWAEANAPVLEADMERFMAKAAAVAKEESIYLLAGVNEIMASSEKQDEIKQLTFDPSGRLADVYVKTIQVPGWEAEAYKAGDGVHTLDTPYGRMGIAICFDADHPELMREAGRLNVDFMFVPSNEWAELEPLHTHMAMFRAIENGYSLLRQTSGTYSLAVDALGNELGGMRHSTSEDKALVVQLSPQGTGGTLYAAWGDWFAWGCLVFALGLIGSAKFNHRKNGALNHEQSGNV